MRLRQWFYVVGSICFLSVSTRGATPLLQYQFNTPGDVQTSTGSDPVALTTYNGTGTADFVTGSPAGPSAASGDLSLNLATSTSPNNYAATTSTADNPMLDNLTAFTITAWVSNITATTHPEYVFDLGGSGNSLAFALNGSTTADAEIVKIGGGSTQTASFPLSTVSGTWKFIAVTFDSRTDNIIFYEGSTVAGSTLVTGTNSDSRDTIGSPNTFVGIGNTNPGSTNQLVGDLDNVQFFGSALTGANVELERDQDLPEAGCLPAVALSFLALARRRSTREPDPR
jgi:hypothetical protein